MRRSRLSALVRWTLCAGLTLSGACGGGGGSSYNKELVKFNETARPRIDGFAQATSSAYLQYLTSASSSDPLGDFEKQHESATRNLRSELCSKVMELAKHAGSGGTKAKRIEPVLDEVTRVLQDRVEFSLLRSALARPPEEREALLARFPLTAQGPTGDVKGIEALRSVGLADSEGRLIEPAAGTPEYDRYSNWNDADGAFRGQMIILSGGKINCEY